MSSAAAPADTFRESFDGDAVTWRTAADGSVRPFDHRRQKHLLHEGKGAELFKAETGPGKAGATFVHSLPPAAAIEDLRLSVWVRSNQPGLRLCLRLVFPDAADPESGGPLTALLAGAEYTTPGEWQELTCTPRPEAVRGALHRARYRLNGSDLSDRGLYVDQAVLQASFGTSPVEILFDDLTLANVVPVSKPNELISASVDLPAPDNPVEFRLSRLKVDGEPFFPVLGHLHGGAGETVAAFAAAGLNVAWIDDYRDDAVLKGLREAGLWAVAVPPRPPDEEGRPLDDSAAGLLPFGPETRSVLFWHLGNRINPDLIDDLISWVNQLRAADSIYHRPILADVTGSEYAFSRHVDLLAESRHITNTAISYRDYRDWMRSCRTGAFLNTFFWTWIQTEPAEKTISARAAAGQSPVVIEPEQIRQQVYAAVQAGCRGLGYWITADSPLVADTPGAEERRLTLARLNLELELLGPLLATSGRKGDPFPFTVKPPTVGSTGLRTRPSYHQITMTGPLPADTPFAPTDRPIGIAEAVMLSSDDGPLLVAVWYGESAQFCPGQMAAANVNIVAPVHETAKGYLLTPTGVKPLNHRPVAGGKQITIPKFDQTAVVLFANDRSVIDRFERRAAALAPRCAQVSVDLARAKRARVAAVFARLVALSADEPDGAAALRKADSLIAEADAALRRRDYDAARSSADDAMQELRILQRTHWESAVRRFASPLASPHAVCFSTLPDHYQLIAKVGRGVLSSSQETNLLPSGGFEEADLIGLDWRHLSESSDAVATGASVVPKEVAAPKQGGLSLCLSARRREGVSLPRGTGSAFAKVESPVIRVTAGQVLHVSGWVRIDSPIASNFDGATLYDSLLGPSSGLRWTSTKGWQRFEMLREVPRDSDFTLAMTLQGVGDGDVYFDDLRVVAVTPQTQFAAQPDDPRRTTRR